MDFRLPQDVTDDRKRFNDFLDEHLRPHLARWMSEGVVPRVFFESLGREGWLGHEGRGGRWAGGTALKQAVLMEDLARLSPGVAVTVVVQTSLGMKGLSLFGSPDQKAKWLEPASRGDLLVCLGNTEAHAGSDVAAITTRAERADGGWVLIGTKAYITSANTSDLALVTAVSHADAPRSKRMSMFVVDLNSAGITRRKLHKEVWIPSDLTRVQMKDVFVPDENRLGDEGRGLHQVLEIFSQSRLSIAAITLGTALGAFDLAFQHARSREAFGHKIADYQAKSFEMADLWSKMEAARLVLWRSCMSLDRGEEYRLDSSIAKYLSVAVAREASMWAADLFGAASVMVDHPVHKFPMDAWASSLGEGTQDIQKLIIFRELMKRERVV